MIDRCDGVAGHCAVRQADGRVGPDSTAGRGDRIRAVDRVAADGAAIERDVPTANSSSTTRPGVSAHRAVRDRYVASSENPFACVIPNRAMIHRDIGRDTARIDPTHVGRAITADRAVDQRHVGV